MPFNTLTVGAAVTPTVLETWVSHYLNRKPLHHKPTAHVSYHLGLRLVRQFLDYASYHTVDDLQDFTAQRVPAPQWVRTEEIEIPGLSISKAAEYLITHLGTHGVEQVGGATWWQWRHGSEPLRAVWIEMRKDHTARQRSGQKCTKVMLYLHGGAYFFGSVDEHRYQMQRHARKLKARVLAPRYRLAPQYPFPCGLLDCLAAYIYLLTVQDPKTIIVAGDSAGGGMVVSLLVILRDQGLPLPAGGILISPWVDLTHSFPSITREDALDYIPSHGFHHRPSMTWPPPNSDDLELLGRATVHSEHVHDKMPEDLTIRLHEDDGTRVVQIKGQIQMYTTNNLLRHPLVSPVLQPTLGGLPPLLILAGGGELLRDEQIYLAHKAAAPSRYPTANSEEAVDKWPPTNIQLQVWDDMCHVLPTLSFARPAKYMYRSIAQFGAWALARAQHTAIRIMDDDEVSVSSSHDDDEENTQHRERSQPDENTWLKAQNSGVSATIGKAGDALPAFHNHMIRQRVTRHGDILPLAPASELPACTMAPSEIGVIKPGPVRKWLAAKAKWDKRFAKEKLHVQKQRLRELQGGGYGSVWKDEQPPPTALAGRRKEHLPKVEKSKFSKGLAVWSSWGSQHDKAALEREEEVETEGLREDEAVGRAETAAAEVGTMGAGEEPKRRRGSLYRDVSYAGQTGEDFGDSRDGVARV